MHLSSGEICIELQNISMLKLSSDFVKFFLVLKPMTDVILKVSFFWTIKIIMFYGAAVGTSAAYG